MATHDNRPAVSLDSSAGGSGNGCDGVPPPQAKPTQRVQGRRLPSGPKHSRGRGDGPHLQMMEGAWWCEGTREWIMTMCFQ